MADAVIDRAHPSVATIVAVAPPDRRDETAAALEFLHAASAVRTILVTLGDQRQPEVATDGEATVIEGLVPQYLNNAVASLRLSSLPSLAWWRGGDPSTVGDLSTLVDRLVLDSESPIADWTAAATLHDRAAISDLRWARLTRWRNLLAQFFDVPDVRNSAATLNALTMHAADTHAAQLFAAWLTTTLPHGRQLAVSIQPSAAGEPMESISLSGPQHEMRLVLLPSHGCVETSITPAGKPATTRVVPLGDQSLPALLTEELRIRSRDDAFERAIAAVVAR